MYSLLADGLLVFHLAYVVFVVAGQAGIVAGGWRGWGWVRNFWFRAAHLGAIVVVVVQAWAGAWCPLTVWENRLRIAAGQVPAEGTFIAQWLGALIYHDAPEWVFTAAYTLFGALTAASWILVPPRSGRGRDRKRAGGEQGSCRPPGH